MSGAYNYNILKIIFKKLSLNIPIQWSSFFFLFAEARIEDFITISVDDKTFKISKDEMKKILARADLESLGYEKEELTTTSKDSKGNSVNSTIIEYFKKVPCSDASKTFKGLKNRISG